MEDKKVTENERNRTEFRIGKEAVEEYMPGDEKADSMQKPDINTDANVVDGIEFNRSDYVDRPLIEMYPEVADDKDEKLLADVRRHWLGRLGIIITGSFVVFLVIALGLTLPSISKTSSISVSSNLSAVTTLVFMLVALLVAAGAYIALWVYNHSRLLITNENVIELKQMSLFSHKVSHLNMINVEDVTVIKRGILQTLFDYGTLQIETAGEKDNFSFPNTPNPDQYRRMVITAHEEAIEKLGKMGSAQRVNIAHN